MSEINANIVVEPIELNVTQSSINQNITVEPINLGIYTTAPLGTPPGGTNGQLQFNNANVFGGVPSTVVASGNLTFTNLANLKIDGGVNGYVLQTDGTGVLAWTAQSGGGGGTGNPGGANTQIQYNDAGVFGGNAGFTYDNVSGIVNLPTDLNVVSDITSTSGAFFGDGYGLSNITGANVSEVPFAAVANSVALANVVGAGNIASLNLDGNVANVLLGDGTFSTLPRTTEWDSVANIKINDIFVGKMIPSTSVVQPGANLAILPGTDPTAFATITTNITGNILDVTALSDANFWAATVTGGQTIGTSSDGNSWTNYATTGCTPLRGPVEGSTNLVIFDGGTAVSAYSTDFGVTWNTSTLPNSGLWQDLAYGDGNFVLCTTQPAYNRAAYSTDDGVTWGSSPMPGSSNPSWLHIAALGGGSNEFVCADATGGTAISTSGGLTWTAGNSLTANDCRDLIYDGGYYVALYDQGIEYRLPGGSTWTQVSFGSGNYQKLIWADPYWVAFDGGSDEIRYATVISGPWTIGTTNAGTGAYSAAWVDGQDNILSSRISLTTNQAQFSISPKIQVTSSDGNYANAQYVSDGSYRALGAPAGGIGGMWTKLS
tara:strand:+ start:10382 stop:12187 length:1806 start_codon:yes stop_codon:yes gene_type:complete